MATKQYMTEIKNGDYVTKYMIKDDQALNLFTGTTMPLKEFNKLLEKSQKSNWNLITESEPLKGDEVSANAEIVYADVTYVIDNKMFPYEMDIALEHEQNYIFVVKYNTETETQHYKMFDEIDSSLLAIVNSLDNANSKEDESYMDKEMLLAKIVACLEPEHEVIADSKDGYNTSKGIIFYDEASETYRLQKLSLEPKKKVKRNRL